MPPDCPNCRQTIPRIRLLFTTAWTRWRCSGCSSLLGVDVRRRLLAIIPCWIAILFVLIFEVRITRMGDAVVLSVLIGAGFLNFFLFDRAVVREGTGFRCRQCGYDLQGQVEARCPECGSAFDPAELAAYRANGLKTPPAARRSWIRFAGVHAAIILTVLLIGSILYLKGARRRSASQRIAASQRASQTAGQAIPHERSAAGDPTTTTPVEHHEPAGEPGTPSDLP